MDPLTALSLAGNVVQFVDFGNKLLSQSRELYRSTRGSLAADDELHLVTADLRALILKLRNSSGHDLQDASPDFAKICDEAVGLAQEILTRIDGLRVTGKHRAWKSLHQAIRSAWSQKETDALVKRLSTLKQALETRVLLSVREKLDVLSTRISGRLDQLDSQTKRIIAALLNAQQTPPSTLSDEMKDVTRALTQLLSRLSNSTDDDNRQLRSSLIDNGHFPQQSQRTNRDEVVPFVEMLDVSRKDEESFRLRVQNHILASLAFSTMTQRYEDVADAHQNTFEWAFHEKTTGKLLWSNFSDWLVQGDGIYWVNGKAGSGKSTLLKFIYDDARARQYLQSWAGEIPLAMAAFFFWNSGTSEQKSQRGLLKSLLHDICSQYPELIPILLPLDWARTYSDLLNPGIDARSMSWLLKTLMSIFKNLVAQTEVKLKLCLFVDGLDEYDGDHEELGDFFQDIASLPHVKACLSSRPWVVFEDLFKGCPSLRLQDLTHKDIRCFVDDRLHSSDVYRALAVTDSVSASALVYEIVQKADGVFLWVKLVVRSLLTGLRNRDTIPDLRKRLSVFPKELGPLYDHLCSLIEPVYKEWASKAFQIMRATQDQRDCIPAGEANSPPLTTLALYIAMNEDLRVVETSRRPSEQLSDKLYDTNIQLTARCAGLLEVKQESQEREHQYTIVGISPQTVHWLHRTARDYIEHPAKWAEQLELTATARFNPNSSMLRSCVLLLGFQRIETDCLMGDELVDELVKDSIEEHAWFLSTSALIYAHHSDVQTSRSQTPVLDQLAVLLSTPFKGGRDPYWQHSTNWIDYVAKTAKQTENHMMERVSDTTIVSPLRYHAIRSHLDQFLPLAMMYGLVCYVRERIRPQFPRSSNEPSHASMLYYIPSLSSGGQGLDFPRPRPEMVELLFELGADPNAEYYNAPSSWERLLHCIASFYADAILNNSFTDEFLCSEGNTWCLSIASLHVKYGASPFTKISSFGSFMDTREWTATEVLAMVAQRNPAMQKLLDELTDRFHRRNTNRRHDKSLQERRERIDTDYSRRRRRY